MVRVLLIAIIVTFVFIRQATAGEKEAGDHLAIAENGMSVYTIVTPARPSPAESLAAAELARYLKQMSGAEIPIRRGGVLPENALVVCRREGLGEWKPAVDCPTVEGDDYAILASGGRVYLVGARGRAVLYAVYDLLARIGCRWLAPRFDSYQDSAESIPAESRLSIVLPPVTIERPAFAYRKLDVGEAQSHNQAQAGGRVALVNLIEWMPKARLNTLVVPTEAWNLWHDNVTPYLQARDITIEVGGHGYNLYLNGAMEGGKLYERHPDWMWMDEKGVRRDYRDALGRVAIFCTSNPQAMDYFLQNVTAYLREHPEIDIFDCWPPDGGYWCNCERCRALGDNADRQSLILARVKAALAAVRPAIRLECIAYDTYIDPPGNPTLDMSVMVEFCPAGQCFESQIYDAASKMNAGYAAALEKWRTGFAGHIGIYTYYRKYAWRSLPVMIAHYMQKELQYYRKLPLQGVQNYSEPGDWFTYELTHYVLAKLEWNPDDDVDAIINGLCERRYGPAAGAAANLFAVLEDVVRRYCSVPQTKLKSAPEIGHARQRLREAMDGLAAARAAAKDDPAIVRNIGRLLLTAEYAWRDLEIQYARASKESDDEIRDRVESLIAFLDHDPNDAVFLIPPRFAGPGLMPFYGIQ
ncbi:MAG: DUF4838 domain-containing protein [bacterium]|nr:DUF4838 domain-containing protein [bacterium]